MPNHYHFEIETPIANLGAAMQWIKTSYSIYFNRRHNRIGHLFQGRYKAVVVEKDTHLLELTRYIHLNPVRAFLVTRPEEYTWSSYQQYATGRDIWPWLETSWTLERFGGNHKVSRTRYRQFVEDGLEGGLIDPLRDTVAGMILGGERFVDWVSNEFLSGRNDPPAVSAQEQIHPVDIVTVIRVVGELMGVEEDQILTRGRHGNIARELAVFLAQRYCRLTNVEIGEFFNGLKGTNVSYISRKAKARLNSEPDFQTLYERAREILFSEG